MDIMGAKKRKGIHAHKISVPMKNKIIASFAAFCICVLVYSCNYAPGSYVNAEDYTINASDTALIKAINQFKQGAPNYKAPLVTIDGKRYDTLKDHLTKDSLFYIAYFYIKETDEILFTYISAMNSKKTKWGFVSVSKGIVLGNWKDINRDFPEDNKMQIEQFEQFILKPIRTEAERKNNEH